MSENITDHNRRKFFKVTLSLVAGTAIATYSKPSSADPIQLIVQAMSEAAKWALDAAIQQIETMMGDLWDMALQKDTAKVAKVGDGVNATKVAINNQKILRATMPSPGGCNVESNIYRKEIALKDFESSMEKSKANNIKGILGDRRSYAAGLRDQLREHGFNFTNATSRGGLIFSPSRLFGDVTRALTVEEEEVYRQTSSNLVGIDGVLKETISTSEGVNGKLERKKFISKANAKTVAMSVFEIDISSINSGVYTQFYQQLEQTYFSATWRSETAFLADIVPAGINYFNQNTAKLDALNHLLKVKEQTLVLLLIKVLQDFK